MRRNLRRVLVLGLLMLPMTIILAQQNQPAMPLPRIDFASPFGAKAGTTIEVTLSGIDLDELESLLFTHPNIKASEVPEPPMKEDPKADPKKNEPPKKKQARQQVKFNIAVGADVPPGFYDIRAVNKWGISNPRVFTVGQFNEISEKEDNNDVDKAQKIELGTTINGVLNNPTDVDFFSFTAKKDQRVLLSCLTSSIDSLAEPIVEIWSPTGRQLATNRNYRNNDALTDFTIPSDGDYLVRVTGFTYTVGGPNYFYRLTVSTAPWIDAISPTIVEPGKTTSVTLYGRNLPGSTPEPSMIVQGKSLEKLVVSITPPNDPLATQRLKYQGRIDPKMSGLDGFEYQLKTPGGISNPVFIGFAREKVVLEKENNDKLESAEEVPAPCEIGGRFDKRGDIDWYAFNAKKGDSFWIELFADRIGSNSLFNLRVYNPANKQDIANLEDTPDSIGQGQFYTRNGDPPAYKFTAPADGKYLVRVGCLESNVFYGPRANYVLRIGTEKPDFRVIAMPANLFSPYSTVLGADGHYVLDLFVWRRDGFDGPIEVSAEGLPPGVTCSPQLIGSRMREGSLVLSAAGNAAPFSGTIKVKATAKINGQSVSREVRSATITWPVQPGQNIPTISRLDESLVLAVRDKAPFRIDVQPEKAFIKKEDKLTQPFFLKQGESLTVPYAVTRIHPDAKQPITLQQIATQQNMQGAPLTVNNGQPLPAIAADKKDGSFVISSRNNSPLGVYTVVLRSTTQIPFTKDPNAKQKQNISVSTTTQPITITLLPLQVAKVSVIPPKGSLKGGTTGEITVKVERQFDYAGEFKVKLVLPDNVKGISANEVTIPTGKNEANLTLKVAEDAPAGNVANIGVQAIAMQEGKVPTVHEAKFNVNVEKAPPKKEEKKDNPPKKDEKKDNPPKKEEKKDNPPKKDVPPKKEEKKTPPKK